MSGEKIKKRIISAGEGNSIMSHAHLDLTAGPQPFLENLPYGAEIKKSSIKTNTATLNISIKEKL
jgi:hypothetical protein